MEAGVPLSVPVAPMPIPVEAVEMSEINTQQHQQQEKPNHFDAIERSKNHALVARPSSAIEGGLVPMDIVFTQLNWVVNVKNPSKDAAAVKANPTIEKKVLNQVSGVFRPGKLTAVMGASGAGKTTLLNVIAGYGSGGRTEGDILVNGEKVDSSFMRELSGFVHQSDVILESMTVREALALAAHLRLPRSMSFEEKNNRVEEILRWLNLVKCADNQIGSPEKKGISGGERRRVSIGMELVRNVSTLFLDEPTSGLDSFTAYNVGHLLRTVAHQHNRTIVATIHQPSSEIFQLFDELVLLHLGRVIYHGPADEVMNYFHKYLNYTIPKYINPADFIFMSILNDAGRQAAIGVNRSSLLPGTVDIEKGGKPEADPSAVHAKREESLISMWNDGKNETDGSYSYPLPRQQLDLNIKESSSLGRKLPDRKEMALNYSTFWTQFYFLCRRAFFDVIRNPFKLRARIGQASFMALLAALCYLHAGYDQASVQNRRGVLFFFCAGGTMNATMGTLMIFTPEKAVFRREYSSRMYSLPSFFFSKMAMELPLRIIMPIWMALIVYWAVGLQNDAEHFFIFASTLILIDLVGNGLGTLFASIFPSLPIALAASPMVLLPLMLFSGFFLNSDSIPPYFEWISYLSPIKYGFTALAKNEFPGLTFHCGDQTTNSVSACPYKTGDDVIRQLNFDSQPSLAENEGILLALAVGFFTLAYIVLWRTSKSI